MNNSTFSEFVKIGSYEPKNSRIGCRTYFGWEYLTANTPLTEAQINALLEKFGADVCAEIGIKFNAATLAAHEAQIASNAATFEARNAADAAKNRRSTFRQGSKSDDVSDGFAAGLARCGGIV